MPCPPAPPTGVDTNTTPDQVRQLIDQVSQTAINGPTQPDRDRAYVRMLILQQYLSDLVNCHMTLHVQNLTNEVASLRATLAASPSRKNKSTPSGG